MNRRRRPTVMGARYDGAMSVSARHLGARLGLGLILALAVACPSRPPPVDRPPPTVREGSLTLSIIGTNDLHGALDRLPILAGYVANLRAAREADGGQLLVIDAGDMFQGTLGSNLGEGAAVVKVRDYGKLLAICKQIKVEDQLKKMNEEIYSKIIRNIIM
jgi:hypothetical protein